MLNKLHTNYLQDQEGKAPAAQTEQDQPKRKPNFFERKRFVDYDQNNDSDGEKPREQQTAEKPKMMVQQMQFENVEVANEVVEEVVEEVHDRKK